MSRDHSVALDAGEKIAGMMAVHAVGEIRFHDFADRFGHCVFVMAKQTVGGQIGFMRAVQSDIKKHMRLDFLTEIYEIGGQFLH